MAQDNIARGLALRGLKKVVRSATGPRVGAIGDSITASTYQETATVQSWVSAGYLSWARQLTRQRFEASKSLIFATGGYTTTQIVANHLEPAAASAADIVCVLAGTNDISGNTPAATVIANLDTIYSRLNRAGKMVIAIPILPRGAPSAFTANQKKIAGCVNTWIKRRAASSAGVLLADPTPYLNDYATGDVVAPMMRDGLHPNPAGAYFVGKAIADVLGQLLTPSERLFSDPNDVYDAALNPTGNLLTNGMFAGTGGTGGATGVKPTGWSASQTGANTTGTYSKEDHPSLVGLSRSVLTMGGTGDGGSCFLLQGITTNVSAGDTLQAEVEVEWDGLANMSTIAAVIQVTDGLGASLARYDGWNTTSFDWSLPNRATSAILRPPPLVIPTGFTALSIALHARSAVGGGAVSGVVKWSRASLRKVGV